MKKTAAPAALPGLVARRAGSRRGSRGMGRGQGGTSPPAPSREVLLALLKENPGQGSRASGLRSDRHEPGPRSGSRSAPCGRRGTGSRPRPARAIACSRFPTGFSCPEIRDGSGRAPGGSGRFRHWTRPPRRTGPPRRWPPPAPPKGAWCGWRKNDRGAGEVDRQWFSPGRPGALLSQILRPKLPPSEASRLVLLTAVAVAEAIRRPRGLRRGSSGPTIFLAAGRRSPGSWRSSPWRWMRWTTW